MEGQGVMKYYILVSGGGGKTVLATLLGSTPKTIDDPVIKSVLITTATMPYLRYFLVDEERYNRWWREYLERD